MDSLKLALGFLLVFGLGVTVGHQLGNKQPLPPTVHCPNVAGTTLQEPGKGALVPKKAEPAQKLGVKNGKKPHHKLVKHVKHHVKAHRPFRLTYGLVNTKTHTIYIDYGPKLAAHKVKCGQELAKLKIAHARKGPKNFICKIVRVAI